MRLTITLVLILSIITHGYSDPKKPKGCTKYSCNDWDWKNKKGLFDPHTIKWPIHYTGETYKDKIDGGNYHIDVAFNHYGHYTRVPLKDYRNSVYHKDPWFLDKGIKMNDPFYCEAYWHDEPSWKDNTCAMVLKGYEDKRVYVDGPGCSKIIREWTVIDWCKYEPNTKINSRPEKYALVKDLRTHEVYFSYGSGHHDIEHDGWYSFQQVVKILDKYPPEIADCYDLEYDLEGSCEAKIKLKNKVHDTGPCPGENMEVEVKVYRTDGYVVLTKWLHVKNEKEFWINLGYLKAGDYLIHWSVRDGCGNSGGCTQKLKIVDKNPPHIICIEDLSTAINDDYGATIWAKDFVHKVQGPCYDNNLTYSFYPDSIVTSLTFNCPDGPGLQEMEVYVTSSNGVQSSCNVSLFVADHAHCNPDAMQIAGKVTDKFKRPVEGAEIMIEAEKVYINSGMTNKNGVYSVSGISFDLGRPIILASVDDRTNNGLDALDLIYMLRHIYDIEKLENSDERAAADVNSDGVIDMSDYLDLTDLIYDIPGREAKVNAWKFYDEKTGIFAGFNHMRLVEPIKLARYRHEYSMIGLKTGDINFSWRPEVVAGARAARKSSEYSTIKKGELRSMQIQVPALDDIRTFSLVAKDITREGIVNVSAEGEELVYVLQELEGIRSLIIMSKTNLAGRTIEIVTHQEVNLAQKGLLFDTKPEGEGSAFDWQLNEVNISDDAIRVNPNPFDDMIMLSIEMDTGGPATFEIFESTGKILVREDWTLVSGINERRVNTSLFRSGLYIIRVTNGTTEFVKRIIKK